MKKDMLAKSLSIDVWAWCWIANLIFVHTFLNASGVLHVGLTTGNHTGNLIKLGFAFLQKDENELFFFFKPVVLVLLAFFIGAFLLGLFLEEKEEMVFSYGKFQVPFLVLLFVCSVFPLPSSYFWYLMALGMGFQNAMYFRLRNYLIRTTHMTGVVTDMAVSLAYILRGKKEYLSRFVLCSSFLFVFVLAAFFAFLNHQKSIFSLEHVAFCMQLLACIFHFIYVYKRKKTEKN